MTIVSHYDCFRRIVKEKLCKSERSLRNRLQRVLQIIQLIVNLKEDELAIVSRVYASVRLVIDERESQSEVVLSKMLTKISLARILLR
jgi:hypothetical protein